MPSCSIPAAIQVFGDVIRQHGRDGGGIHFDKTGDGRTLSVGPLQGLTPRRGGRGNEFAAAGTREVTGKARLGFANNDVCDVDNNLLVGDYHESVSAVECESERSQHVITPI